MWRLCISPRCKGQANEAGQQQPGKLHSRIHYRTSTALFACDLGMGSLAWENRIY
jgi:hypothetical protein